jgi:hypothetical protein
VKVVFLSLNDRISKRDVIVSEVELPLFADIIDTEQNLSDEAGSAELAVPDLMLM